MIKVSVVIPFYSKEPGRLIKAVESALSQSTSNIEVIVVDDCSPVSAQQELANLKDPRLIITRHAQNTNGGVARNTGVELAQGQFIAFLDYDDIWYQDKLEQQLAFWHSLNDSDAVSYCKCKIIEGQRSFYRPERGIKPYERVGNYLFESKQIIQTSGIFLPAKLAKKVKFHNLKRHQDYQLCLSLESEGAKFYYLNSVLYEFIQVPKLNDYNFSLEWLNKYSEFLTPAAIVGFKKLVVLRSKISHGRYCEAFKYSAKNGFSAYYLKAVLAKLIKSLIARLRRLL